MPVSFERPRKFLGGTALSDNGESPIASLLGELKRHNIEIEPEWNTDGPIRNNSQWFVGKRWEHESKTYYRCWFGDYKRDLREEWKSFGKLNKKEQTVAEEQSNDLLAKEKEARERIQVEAAVQCQREWETFHTSGETPYMRRKQINANYGSRIRDNDNGDAILIIPLRDIDGVLWNYQRIYSQKLSKGDKFFADGAKIEGCFHVINWSKEKKPTPGKPIYIAEGFATAASVFAGLAHLANANGTRGDEAGLDQEPFVVTAFNAGNISHCAAAIHERFPQCPLVFCADNDAYTTIKKGGTEVPYNVGVEKARRAAGANGGEVVYPIFKYAAKGLTDFNDLHCAEGLDRVADQILNFHKYATGIQPINLTVTKSGKIQEPTEEQICNHLLKYFGDNIVRQDKSLFVYRDNHWTELGPTGLDSIKQMIAIAANKLLGSRDIQAYFQYFFIHAPVVPRGVDLFKPNPFCANFQNGTLHNDQTPGKREFSLVFKKHDPKDFLTSVLPFDMPDWKPGQPLPPAPKFDAMIERLWAKNSDKAQVKQLSYELVGAAFMPTFPIIVIYHGAPNSGKSTFIKLIVRLVSSENVCSVQLCDMQGFNMESMIGKLVNFDTDIDVNKPMNDSEVKKLIDRVPRRVRRKGVSDVYAHLPAVHLFAANRPPKSLDGSSHAYGRRMILVKTDSEIVDRVLDFERELIAEEIEGIVARGLEGLHRLIQSQGLYTVPESSGEQVRNLEMESDIIGQFLKDVEMGEVRTEKAHLLMLGEKARIERPVLWEAYFAWQERAVSRNQQLGKHDFLERFERRGFEFKRDAKGRYFEGIGLTIEQDPIA